MLHLMLWNIKKASSFYHLCNNSYRQKKSGKILHLEDYHDRKHTQSFDTADSFLKCLINIEFFDI